MTSHVGAATELIRRWLAYQIYIRDIPGAAVGIALGERVLLATGFGYADLAKREPVTERTLFRVASHSKLFTATTVALLAAEGRLRFDDPVAAHLDWFRSDADPNLADVTVRQLLCHSSGINRDGDTGHWYNDAFPDREALMRQTRAGLSQLPALAELKYSNMAFAMLGQIIEAVCGADYPTVVRRRVLEPLALADTYPNMADVPVERHATGYGKRYPNEARQAFHHIDARAMDSATGFSTTVLDLLRFYAAHRVGSGVLLSDSLKREMQRTQYEQGSHRWGLGFEIFEVAERRVVGHGGAYPGFISRSFLDPDSGLAVALLTNAVDGPAAELVLGVGDIVAFAERRGFDLASGDADDTRLHDRVSGCYRTRWGVLMLQRVGGRLLLLTPDAARPSQAIAVLKRIGGRRFLVEEADPMSLFYREEIEFEIDGDSVALRHGANVFPAFAPVPHV